MHKQSIVVDVRMINSSGIGTYLKNILPIISNKFRLILLGNKKELETFNWVENMETIQFDAKIYTLKEQLQYPIIIPKCQLFWCPHINTPLFQVKASKMVSTIHDVNHLAVKKNNFFIKKRYAKKLIKNTISKSEKIITVSEFSKSEILKYTNADEQKVKVIYNGIHQNFSMTNNADTINTLPKKYFLFVGNVKPHKNLITLLKAYLNLPKEIKSVYKIVVLGKNDGFITPDKGVYQFIKENKLENSIHFTGYLSDAMVPSIYINATIFVFPTNYEGFGLPLLESMVCHTPVICSDIPCFKEIAGNAALYFEKNNFNNLSEKISLLLSNNDLKDKLVCDGIERAKLFSWMDAANEHIKVFQEILENDNS